jgi:hypothetical protein
MLFNDSWTKGLTPKQQNLVIEYIQNGCKPTPGLGTYKTVAAIKRFVNSEKGRRAIRAYANYFFDKEKELIKIRLLKMYLPRTFFNPADIIDSDGLLLPKYQENLKKLKDLAFCIDGIEKKETGYGTETKIKFCDRDKAKDFIVELFRIMEPDDEDEKDGYEKSVYEMTDEERDEEIKRLMDRGKLLTGNNGNGKKGKKS